MDRYNPSALAAVFPRFANFKLLGQGGEGAVFAVWDRVRHTDVALKLMRNGGGSDLSERVEREYRILASSRSPNLVRVFDHGREAVPVAEGRSRSHFWYTMERCEGNLRSQFRTLPLGRRTDIVLQMLDGLAFLHAMNIAHRDIKPDNLFVVNNSVKIGDFGLARTDQASGQGGGVLGECMGSPPYLAPERWTTTQSSDWRPSDQYAAGVTLYEILSAGGVPFNYGMTIESTAVAHHYAPVLPMRIPELRARPLPALDGVVGKMLAKKPERRYADVAECKRALSAALAQEDVLGRASGLPRT